MDWIYIEFANGLAEWLCGLDGVLEGVDTVPGYCGSGCVGLRDEGPT